MPFRAKIAGCPFGRFYLGHCALQDVRDQTAEGMHFSLAAQTELVVELKRASAATVVFCRLALLILTILKQYSHECGKSRNNSEFYQG